jgi:hypothetical protein
MTSGRSNMVYIAGQRKNPEKPIPVISKERIREAQAFADKLKKSK